MITLEINDAQLEQKIIEKAKAIGKTAQDFLRNIVEEKVEESTEKLPFEVPKLDYRKFSKIYEPEYVDENIEQVKLFSQVKNTKEFAKKLRNNSWERK
jgi:negative regulator of replication initiation